MPLSPEQRRLNAARFPQRREYVRALRLLERASADMTLEYDVAVDNILVLPRWSYDRLIPLLDTERIGYVEIKVGSFRDLLPETQASLRGLSGGRS